MHRLYHPCFNNDALWTRLSTPHTVRHQQQRLHLSPVCLCAQKRYKLSRPSSERGLVECEYPHVRGTEHAWRSSNAMNHHARDKAAKIMTTELEKLLTTREFDAYLKLPLTTTTKWRFRNHPSDRGDGFQRCDAWTISTISI